MKIERLRKLREKKGISQTEAAKRLGIVRTTYSNYESGNREPDIETIEKIARFYDVSVDYLLGISDTKRASLVSNGVLEAHKNAAVIAEIADKYGIDLSDPAKKKQLEGIVKLIVENYVADKSDEGQES
ncbi:helix-turn-helix domain-containing protein [Paenibacillus naphthalenovorans]|uniref:helix-turn-helix domain-containing protein n=1 Tax=Paenibacillus naphthalenovorans TaxID=162209 RepID=UPI00088A514F|nr:helix-turn-helix domain-containing protein [Paenibacillus naphthalenovorans]SDJ62270.1 DNA-binding transcriptional regulator, XRE-family HTH domain [Paenibacillus naphthalenovorans]